MKKNSRLWNTALLIGFSFAACPGLAASSKSYDGIQCGKTVRESLFGRTISNQKVVELEKQYKQINLKAIGSELPEQGTTLDVVSICGNTYHLLLRKSKVTDVLEIKGDARAKFTTCKQNGTVIPGEVNYLGESTAPKRAWTIDYATGKFSELALAGLKCDPTPSDAEAP